MVVFGFLVRNFKLNESTFLASLIPKKEIGADRFIEAHPKDTVTLDSVVDPVAVRLQVTLDGKARIVDILDCIGSGDIVPQKW
ncbi:hypothetical protein SLA2020_059360 [Shorea laevis]